MAIFDAGDKVLIAHRRLFENDSLRFFLGCVKDYEAGVLKIEGKSCVQDPATGGVLKKDGTATKVYALQAGTILVYLLPSEPPIEEFEFIGHMGSLCLRHKDGFKLNLSERFESIPGSSETRKWSLFSA